MKPEIIQIATTALHAAVRNDWPAAKAAVEQVTDADDLMTVILAWCDTCLNSQGIGMEDRPIAVMWRVEGTEDNQHAGEVPAEVAWAGQLINARAADDEATFMALVEAVPDGAEWGRHVGVLLDCVAATLRATAGAA